MSDKLLPCPFCGFECQAVQEADDGPGFDVTCDGCVASVWAIDERRAVRDWNSRKPGPATKNLLDTYAKHIVETARQMDQGQGFDKDTLKMIQAMEAFIAEWEGDFDA